MDDAKCKKEPTRKQNRKTKHKIVVHFILYLILFNFYRNEIDKSKKLKIKEMEEID